jgi:hypothetical protein
VLRTQDWLVFKMGRSHNEWLCTDSLCSQHHYAIKSSWGWALVAHACNPSYSGGSDQEDLSAKSAWANSSQDPILKKPNTKKGWRNASNGSTFQA